MQRAVKILKVFGIMAIVIISIILIGIGYISWALPNVGDAPAMKIELTRARLKRGEYLANNVMVCGSCHGTRNWNQFGAPLEPGTFGAGGSKFTQDSLGFFDEMYFPNITPAALANWTDGEIFRVITTGVRKDGKPVTPIMPYHEFGQIDAEDVKSVIAYLRTLPPLYNKVPKSNISFPMRILNKLSTQKAAFQKKPPESDTVAYGKYLATAAACAVCHTPFEGLSGVNMDKAFSGGPVFTMQSGRVQPINLTPDIETGIGKWSKEDFLNKFKIYRDSSVIHRTINAKKDFNSLMAWPMYAHMTDEDLAAIYKYLRSIKPIKNKVVKFSPNF